jgi:hypothetical protein
VRIRSALPFTQRASFRQYIDAAIITVIPDFMVVGFPVDLAFRSFRLSGRSNFHSDFSLVIA